MHSTVCLLSLTIFLSGSLAELCYECTDVSQGSSAAYSCAGGKFDRNALPNTVRVKDCGAVGCLKTVVTASKLGITSYARGCSNQMFNENKCYNPRDYFDLSNVLQDLKIDASMTAEFDQMMCVCHGDLCNGAGSLNTRQVVMGVILGVLTIVFMQH